MVRQGDIIWLDLSPTVGHEQSGLRPAVVISNDFAISKTNMVYVAPVTRSVRGFPLHVMLDSRTKTTGNILCEQVKAVDLDARQYTLIEHLPNDILEKVLTRVVSCFDV
ncbi:MAG: type II toxin-antitoxin system PemK/MazF family toxin [Oscillospiraceae bacterium]|jgi:mRNA interferase MazF|nr:type II toxin-antitoxin system PemK/MazF family toxin [Oscillospiraceae bacterium]